MKKEKIIVQEYSAVQQNYTFKNINDVYKKIVEIFEEHPDIEKEIQIQLGTLLSQIYRNALDNTDGFCYKFNLPLVPVQSFYRKLGIPPQKVEEAFRAEWKYPKNTRMYSDSYYQILMLLFYFGLKQNKKVFVNNSLFLVLIKLWNGRRQDLCDTFSN